MKIHKPFQIAWSRWVVAAQVCRVQRSDPNWILLLCAPPSSSDVLSIYYASANTKWWANTLVGWPAITGDTSPALLAKKKWNGELALSTTPPCQQTQTTLASASEKSGTPFRPGLPIARSNANITLLFKLRQHIYSFGIQNRRAFTFFFFRFFLE